jgi:hypothetical protein
MDEVVDTPVRLGTRKKTQETTSKTQMVDDHSFQKSGNLQWK